MMDWIYVSTVAGASLALIGAMVLPAPPDAHTAGIALMRPFIDSLYTGTASQARFRLLRRSARLGGKDNTVAGVKAAV